MSAIGSKKDHSNNSTTAVGPDSNDDSGSLAPIITTSESLDTKSDSNSIKKSSAVVVAAISPIATEKSTRTLFGFLGTIEEMSLQQPKSATLPLSTVHLYVRYENHEDTELALHLNNVVFYDKLLAVGIAKDGIPALGDDSAAVAANWGDGIPVKSSSEQGGLLAPPYPLEGLSSSLPPPPTLPTSADPSKLEEVRRTVYVGNLTKDVTIEMLAQYFRSNVGPIKFARLTGEDSQPLRFAFIEFFDAIHTPMALNLTGQFMLGRPMKINPSKNAVVKRKKNDVRDKAAIMKKVQRVHDKIVKEIKEAASKDECSSAANTTKCSRLMFPSKAEETKFKNKPK
eukprot:UC4_evm5s1370